MDPIHSALAPETARSFSKVDLGFGPRGLLVLDKAVAKDVTGGPSSWLPSVLSALATHGHEIRRCYVTGHSLTGLSNDDKVTLVNAICNLQALEEWRFLLDALPDSSDVLQTIIDGAHKSASLTSLCITYGLQLRQSQVNVMARALSEHETLRRISLLHVNSKDSNQAIDLSPLFLSFCSIPSLESVNVASEMEGVVGVDTRAVQKFFASQSISDATLWGLNLNTTHLEAIAKSLRGPTNLRFLSLRRNPELENGWKPFVEMLLGNTTLLSLYHDGCEDEAFMEVLLYLNQIGRGALLTDSDREDWYTMLQGLQPCDAYCLLRQAPHMWMP